MVSQIFKNKLITSEIRYPKSEKIEIKELNY